MISSLLLGRLGFRAGMPLAQCALWDSRHALRGSGVGEGKKQQFCGSVLRGGIASTPPIPSVL